MKVREDGKYEFNDGRVLTPEEASKLHKTAQPAPEAKKPNKKGQLDLKEGQSSGPIPLHD